MTTRISATLDIAQHNVELDRNHFDMNKFKGTDDIEYQKTVAFISKLCKEAQKVSANRRLKRLPPLRPPTSSTGGSSNNTSQMSRGKAHILCSVIVFNWDFESHTKYGSSTSHF